MRSITKRHFPRQQVQHNTTHRPHIALEGVLVVEHFRRHERRRPRRSQPLQPMRLVSVPEQPCLAIVDELDAPVGAKHDVGGLDVEMRDARFVLLVGQRRVVDGGEGGEDASHDGPDLGLGERHGLSELLQVDALDVLEDDDEEVGALAQDAAVAADGVGRDERGELHEVDLHVEALDGLVLDAGGDVDALDDELLVRDFVDGGEDGDVLVGGEEAELADLEAAACGAGELDEVDEGLVLLPAEPSSSSTAAAAGVVVVEEASAAETAAFDVGFHGAKGRIVSDCSP